MKYLKNERREIQEVYEKYISYIEDNLTSSINHLCYMDLDLEKYESTHEGPLKVKDCGWNNRMLPNAVAYLKSEQPTDRLNRVIWLKPMFRKDIDLKSKETWWKSADFSESKDKISDTVNTTCNREKIEFLQHLIKKLR